MTQPATRRRFLTVLASTAACAALPAGAAAPHVWSGRAMGADARLTISGGLTEREARATFRAVERELARLERIFSLYDSGSQIARLNRTGVLRAPAPELTELLALCDRLHEVSGGLFDPAVQPFWRARAEAAAQGRALSEPDRRASIGRVGWQALQRDPAELRFIGAGRALTLNGIAQGYITDRIADLLRARGFGTVLVDMGEIAAGGRWPVGIAAPGGKLVERITLSDRALATSAPRGSMIGGQGHIVDPRGKTEPLHELVSVSAPSAAVADGLSTAFCLMPKPSIAASLARFPEARLEALV
ncbi:FAD:protein FMN transferase [Marivita sp. GX14005]|uniref:FAD:protein FMN transferase n=1 Tax=Marivita sp. GX14005 TaxID=2942276 RepID=UPI002018474F|nr:FAD:protein FMN transferase [Marivita sp. GX14005]MCL3882713.1 FAD:protein FMN transferase [Marivita sp. GX14005]